MAHINLSLILIYPLLLFLITGTNAVDYVVTTNAAGTPGGARFNAVIGADYTRQTMASASEFIWKIFRQTTAADRKSASTVTLFVDDLRPDQLAYALPSKNEVHVGDDYIERITRDTSYDYKTDFNGVVYHEITHVWQWYPNGQITSDRVRNVTEGIADLVRLKANFVPNGWVGTGGGDHWFDGYSVTARFFDYCNDLRDGFVAEANKRLRNGYNEDFFVQLLGKTADQLWSDYKAKYGTN